MNRYIDTVLLPVIFLLCQWTAEYLDAYLTDLDEPTVLSDLESILTGINPVVHAATDGSVNLEDVTCPDCLQEMGILN